MDIEDPYETALGDGEFHYFRDVFLSREDAQRYTVLEARLRG